MGIKRNEETAMNNRKWKMSISVNDRHDFMGLNDVQYVSDTCNALTTGETYFFLSFNFIK